MSNNNNNKIIIMMLVKMRYKYNIITITVQANWCWMSGEKKYTYVYTHTHICIYIYIFEVCSVFYRRFYIFKYSKTEILKSTERAGWRKNFSRDNARTSFSFSKMTPFQGNTYLCRKIFYHTIINHSIFPFYEEKKHIDDLSPVGEWNFRTEADFYWSHFVISTNLCEYQNSRLRLVWFWQRPNNNYIKKKNEKRINGVEITWFYTQNTYSVNGTLFFRRYLSNSMFQRRKYFLHNLGRPRM